MVTDIRIFKCNNALKLPNQAYLDTLSSGQYQISKYESSAFSQELVRVIVPITYQFNGLHNSADNLYLTIYTVYR